MSQEDLMEFGDCRDCKERLSSCLLPPLSIRQGSTP